MKSCTQSVNRFKCLILIFCLIFYGLLHASGGDAHENRGLYGKENPDFPLNDYVKGKLGVLQPQYRLSYLIVAYRYLTQRPLSEEEQQNVLDAVDRQVNFEIDVTVDVNKSTEETENDHFNDIEWAEGKDAVLWEKVIKLPINEITSFITINFPKKIQPFTKYKFALLRLKSIVEELETAQLPAENKNAVLHEWLNIQDKLLCKQLTANDTRELIAKIPTEHLSLLKSDLDYLQAVSYFNSDMEQSQLTATELFTQLANNKDYPWHEWAEYLSYRTMTRMACPELGSINVDKQEFLKKASSGMQSLAVNAQDPTVKIAANDYKDIIMSRFNREVAVKNLVNTMIPTITLNNFHKMIFFNNTDGSYYYRQDEYSPTVVWNEITENESEILFWIYQYRSSNTQKAFTIAYERWHSSQSAAWLLVALNKISAANPAQQKELLEAAAKIPPSHPGFFSIRYILINDVLLLEGDTRQSKLKRRKLIANTFAQLKAGSDFSIHEHFAKTGIPLARTLEELLNYGFFIPSKSMLAIYEPIYETEHPYYSPIELSLMLNHLPLSVLTEFIQSSKWPTLPKRELYASVWARATLLERPGIADRIAKETGKLNPHLKPYIDLTLKTKNSEQRIEILTKALLYLPELSPIIHLKSTWLPQFDNIPIYNEIRPRKISSSHSTTYWCNGGEINRRIFDEESPPQFSKIPWEGMLTLAQQKELDKEQKQLSSLPNGPVWLLDRAYKMAKKYPKSEESPELLALAINLTRFIDCYESNSAEARKAFYVLKMVYPNSEAAIRTRHHY